MERSRQKLSIPPTVTQTSSALCNPELPIPSATYTHISSFLKLVGVENQIFLTDNDIQQLPDKAENSLVHRE